MGYSLGSAHDRRASRLQETAAALRSIILGGHRPSA